MRLPVKVTFHPETETPQSFASRLARAMGFLSVNMLLGERGTLSVSKGERDAISQLSNWSGVSKKELLRFAVPIRNEAGEWRLGDAVFRKEMKAVRFRYCPHCLTDDIENGSGRPEARAYERASWISRAVTSCTQHGNLLVEAPEEAPKNDIALFVAEGWHLKCEALGQADAADIEVDRYIEGRISGNRSDTFIDRQEVHVLIALFTMLGWFLHNQLPNFIIDGEGVSKMSMRACGFRLVRQGQSAIENVVLEAIRQHCPPVGAIREFFGPMVLQIRRNADFESYKEVANLFQGLVERNVPVGPGDMFVHPVSQRYLHSLNSAASAYGMAPKRVRKALEDRELIPHTNRPGPQVYISVEDAESALAGLSNSMTTVEVAKVLGIHESKVRELVDGGLIEPNERGVADSRPFYRFSRKSIDELVTRIFDKLPVTDDDQGLMRLSEVCMRRSVMLSDLIELIIDRKLTRTFRSDLSCKIGSLLIDLEEVPSLGPAEVQTDMVDYSCYKSLAEVERAISTSKVTVAALVENGFLSTELKFNPRNGLQQPFVHEDTIAEFQRQYMSLFRVSDGCKWNMPKKRDELKKLGVKPIFEVSGKITPFYKIHDLKQAHMLP